jgi:cob(I)alamin adenosyltransferase
MGKRLTRIYTRTGDDGTTGLGDGSRTAKDDSRIEAIGSVDELNCVIGLLLCEELPDTLHEYLIGIQHRLFDIGGELSIPGHSMVADRHVHKLEQVLDELNAELPPLEDFILPGGARAAALCHQARAVCRRAERRVHTLGRQADINTASAVYLNRLSDLLFVMARYLNRQAGEPDVLWRQGQE